MNSNTSFFYNVLLVALAKTQMQVSFLSSPQIFVLECWTVQMTKSPTFRQRVTKCVVCIVLGLCLELSCVAYKDPKTLW